MQIYIFLILFFVQFELCSPNKTGQAMALHLCGYVSGHPLFIHIHRFGITPPFTWYHFKETKARLLAPGRGNRA